jgi:hypothetical protein
MGTSRNAMPIDWFALIGHQIPSKHRHNQK